MNLIEVMKELRINDILCLPVVGALCWMSSSYLSYVSIVSIEHECMTSIFSILHDYKEFKMSTSD